LPCKKGSSAIEFVKTIPGGKGKSLAITDPDLFGKLKPETPNPKPGT
jgi:hypothetical protein